MILDQFDVQLISYINVLIEDWHLLLMMYNLHLIVDDNRISMLGYTDEIVSHNSLSTRLSAFGWDCFEVDGHDVVAIQTALLNMKISCSGKPKALIARTLKGHGVPGLENAPLSHIMNPKPELIDRLLEQNL